MGRPTTNNVNAFDRKQSSARPHPDSAYPHSQLAAIPAGRSSRPARTFFTDEEMSMIQSRGDLARQKRRGRGLFSSLLQSSTATPLQTPHPLPSVISPSDYSGPHRRADGQPPKSSYRANRLYEPLGPPPSHSSPPKQSSRRSPESGSKAINLSDIYRSGGLPKSHERSSNTESESFDCGSIYGPAKVFPRSEGQPGLSRAVYAARENTRADRNRLEGIENASHRRIGHIMKELAPHPEELDDLSCGILADISVLYHGREHDLPTFDA